MTGRELLELRLERGILDVSVDEFYAQAGKPEGLVTRIAERAIGPRQVFSAVERRIGRDA